MKNGCKIGETMKNGCKIGETMFKTIYTPLDNSELSNAAAEAAVGLGRRFGSKLIGSHVYAAKLHDYRFKQMEFTLPEEYQDEKELEKQRRIHDTLITMGLQLISDSYLEVLAKKAQAAGLEFTPKMFDGKNFKMVVQDIQESGYDLVIMGAVGLGAVKESTLGSVTERVVRRVKADVLVLKDARSLEDLQGPIVVGIDGSPESFAGFRTAIELSRQFARPIETVAVYDPYLHYAMFNSIVGVLTEKASKVFKFKEQEQLHEDVIDTGLAKIYQSHLDVAARVARAEGIEVKTTLLDGKAFEKLLQYVRKVKPSLLVLGRIGVHSDPDMDIGSNAENLLRLTPCNVYLSSKRWVPAIDVRAEESVRWTDEAQARLEKAPALVRGIARTAIHRFAMERGHSVITEAVIDQAIGTILPPAMAQRIGVLAEDVAVRRGGLKDGETHICSQCGHVARDGRPVACPVCKAGPERFQKVDRVTLETLSPLEGDVQVEETFDGVSVRWTDESRKVLRRAPSGYMRRRMKARVEKVAKVRRLDTITSDLVDEVLQSSDYADEAAPAVPSAATASAAPEAAHPAFEWTDEAVERLSRVPAGFMRDLTRTRIEAYAQERGSLAISLDLVEKGIEYGRQMMSGLIADYRDEAQANAIRNALGEAPVLNDVENPLLQKGKG